MTKELSKIGFRNSSMDIDIRFDVDLIYFYSMSFSVLIIGLYYRPKRSGPKNSIKGIIEENGKISLGSFYGYIILPRHLIRRCVKHISVYSKIMAMRPVI